MRLKPTNGTGDGTGGGGGWTVQQQLGLARDAVSISQLGVKVGFGIASFFTNMGFGITINCIKATAGTFERVAGPNVLSATLHGANDVVDLAHQMTIAGQHTAHVITDASLTASDTLLGEAGGDEGELLRFAIGDEGAESVMTLRGLIQNFTEPLASSGCTLSQMYAAATAWGSLQRAAGMVREQSRMVPRETARLPAHSERWFRFTAATFGTAWFAGLVDGFSLDGQQRARVAEEQGAGPGEVALACAGVEGRVEVVAFEERSNELFAPGYLVAVDHDFGAVVVALRGTSSAPDALSDLTCKPLPVELGGRSGLAHEGMWRAAKRLQGKLADLAQVGLQKLGNGRARRVVISGHSLGAGVASLVAAQWHASGRFKGEAVACLAFACPQVLDAELAQAQSVHTHSFVVGDDLVPRFSLATAQDLRDAMLLLSNPASGGLEPPEHFAAHALLDLDKRGEHGILAERYASVRPRVCRSKGRLFPSGRVVLLLPGQVPGVASLEEVDELHISRDMGAAHMPRRYLLAIQDAEATLERASAQV